MTATTWFHRTCRIGGHPFYTSLDWAMSCYQCAVVAPSRRHLAKSGAAPVDVQVAADCAGYTEPCWHQPVDYWDQALIDSQARSLGWDPVSPCCSQAAARVLDTLLRYEFAA